MTRDFYDTMAQVLPMLLLALIWDSAYLDRLRGERRAPRRIDPAGPLFWTKPRVRVYVLTVAAITLASMAITIMVVADIIPDSMALRIILCASFILILATLMTRIYYDVIAATSTTEEPVDYSLSGGPDSRERQPPSGSS